MGSYDAVVVGAGPNGLAAAITLAQAGLKVVVFEGAETIGGGTRSAQLTLPGFIHDVCSAIHPLTVASPFFGELPLEAYGLEWIYPELQLAHPFDDGSAAALHRSVQETAQTLGADALAYERLMGRLVKDWDKLAPALLAPFRIPRHPLAMARFGLGALRTAQGMALGQFKTGRGRGFFAGLAGHSIMALSKPGTAAFGLVLGMSGHAVGWPFPRGGAEKIGQALAAHLCALGGEIITGNYIHSLDELPQARATLLDVTPRQLLALAEDRLPVGYRRTLQHYRYGPGVCKVDWALSEPIPWTAPEGRRTATLHLGGTLGEILLSESEVWQGRHAQHPYILLAQQSVFDDSRAPDGKHTAWAYCHVPQGSTVDMTPRIEAQIERFAPGFGDCILARHTYTAAEMARYNPNYVGGDINGGVQDLRQLYTRPAPRLNPYSTPIDGVYLCSSSTPPGGGVHGMCGYFAAQTALRSQF
jgi:phytoene dehydrogenase-like protein